MQAEQQGKHVFVRGRLYATAEDEAGAKLITELLSKHNDVPRKKVVATRADGTPAYLNAPPRRTASDFKKQAEGAAQ